MFIDAAKVVSWHPLFKKSGLNMDSLKLSWSTALSPVSAPLSSP